MSDKKILQWADIDTDTKKLADKILNKYGENHFDKLVGVARGGLVPSAIIAHLLKMRTMDILSVASYNGTEQSDTIQILKGMDGDGEGVLVVDDLVDSGKTFEFLKQKFPKAVFTCLYAKPAGLPHSEIVVKEFPQDEWIVFPWEHD